VSERPRAVRLLRQAAAAAVLQADQEHPAARGAARSDRLLDPAPLHPDRHLTPAEQHRPRGLLAPAAGIAAHLDQVTHAATSRYIRPAKHGGPSLATISPARGRRIPTRFATVPQGTLESYASESLVRDLLPIVVTPGTTKGWVNPSPAQTPQQLVVHGGFAVDDGRTRHLEQRAQRLGFADLRGYLQARSDAGHSIPQLAAELEVSEWTVKRALRQAGVTLLPRAERLARQRRHATDQRLTARAAEFGFTDITEYLADRLLVRGLLLAEVTAELGAHRVTVRRLMDQHGIRRTRRTPREQTARTRGRAAQAAAWQARRAARLAELGFADLAGYLQCRYVQQTWSIRGCGRSCGSGGGGCWPRWHDWASIDDTGHRRGTPEAVPANKRPPTTPYATTAVCPWCAPELPGPQVQLVIHSRP
jgi:hypothetical protein